MNEGVETRLYFKHKRMPFIGEILKYKSLSIVGMEKNTGKTECLNYIIDRLRDSGTKIAIYKILLAENLEPDNLIDEG